MRKGLTFIAVLILSACEPLEPPPEQHPQDAESCRAQPEQPWCN